LSLWLVYANLNVQTYEKEADMKNTLHSIRKAWSEMDEAQRRLFEIRTGIPVTARSRRAAEVAELEDSFRA
jgi:hypothetical protein